MIHEFLRAAVFQCVLVAIASTPLAAQLWLPSEGPYGGSVAALALHPTNGHIFIGGDPSSVYRSTDEGHSWSRVQNNCWSSATRALACGPAGEVYNGTSAGLFRSTNEGATWTNISSVYGEVFALLVTFGGTVFAGTDYGMYRSTNNGASFTQVALFSVSKLAVRSNGTLLAGTDNQGIYRSSDNGATWTASNTGFSGTYVTSLCVQSLSGYFYAGSDKIYRSTDDGIHWSAYGNIPSPLALLAGDFTQTIFVGTANDGIYRTTDNGATWDEKSAGLMNECVSGLFSLPQQRIFALSNAGVFISSDAGETWNESNQGYGNTRIGSLLLRPGGIIFAGDRTNGLYRSSDAGLSWRYWKQFLPNWGPLSIAANDLGNLFVATWRGLYRSLDSGMSWGKLSVPNAPQSYRCILVNDSGHIFLGTTDYFIHKSTDNGDHWSKFASGMSDSLVHALALDRASGIIYAGTEHQGVLRTTNNGVAWKSTGSGLSSVYLDALAVDQISGHVYASTHDGIIHRSTNRGASWENIQNGRTPRPIHAILIHPSGHIFLGTIGNGVERSTNQGGNWEAFNAGVHVNVEALAADSGDILFAGTYSGVQKTSVAVPVEFLQFTARVTGPTVSLHWITAEETNNYGFTVERSRSESESRHPFRNREWTSIGFVHGNGTTSSGSRTYAFLDPEPGAGKFFYRLRQIDLDGSTHYSWAVAAEVDGSPSVISLAQNYPNPFRMETTIYLPGNVPLNRATFRIYDVLGRRIMDLSDRIAEKTCVRIFRNQLPGPGLYFYRLTAGNISRTMAMHLLD